MVKKRNWKASIGSCFRSWVISDGELEQCDPRILAEDWIQVKGDAFDHLDITFSDVEREFARLKNKWLA